jgi:hypothetical protein
MAEIKAIQEVKQDLTGSVRISLYSRGADLITLKLFNRIAGDPKRLWHVSDFRDLGSEIVIKRRLKELIVKGIVVRLRTYPAFYKYQSNR